MKKIITILILIISFTTVAQIEDPIEWNTSVEKISDTEYILIATATIEKSWHLYSQNVPENGPIPTTFYFDETKNSFAKIGKTVEEEGHTVDDKVFEMKIKFFENTAVFKQKIKLKSEQKTILATVEFMVCDDTQCMAPTEIDLEFNLDNAKKASEIIFKSTENKEENIVTSKDIKLLKVGLIKLNNDLQLLDYQSIISKNTSKEVEIKHATRLAFSFTPLRTYKQLIPNLNDSIIVSRFENTESLKTRTSFALNLGMEREINERWEAEWGVNYTRIEQNMNFLYSKKSTPITILFDTNQY